MIVPYATDPAQVVVPHRVRVGALEVTRWPLEDPAVGLAHLSYRDALAVAATCGARLPTTAEIFALHLAAAAAKTELEPVVLPDPFLRSQGCVPGDPRMVTQEWCERHDAAFIQQIKARDLAPEAFVANAGKHWRAGAPAGLAGLCGWWVGDVARFDPSRKGQGFIQQGNGWPHNDGHRDYATTTVLVWDVAA